CEVACYFRRFLQRMFTRGWGRFDCGPDASLIVGLCCGLCINEKLVIFVRAWCRQCMTVFSELYYIASSKLCIGFPSRPSLIVFIFGPLQRLHLHSLQEWGGCGEFTQPLIFVVWIGDVLAMTF